MTVISNALDWKCSGQENEKQESENKSCLGDLLPSEEKIEVLPLPSIKTGNTDLDMALLVSAGYHLYLLF